MTRVPNLSKTESLSQKKPAWLTAPVIGLALALLVALVALALVWRDLGQERDLREAQDARVASAEQAKLAATAATERMTSYDYRSLEEDFAWVTEDGTPKFADTFGKASEPVKKAIVALKAHADGEVTRSAVTLTDDAHATVLMFVDQTISDETSEEKIDQSRVEMVMVLDRGRWLVDEVNLF